MQGATTSWSSTGARVRWPEDIAPAACRTSPTRGGAPRWRPSIETGHPVDQEGHSKGRCGVSDCAGLLRRTPNFGASPVVKDFFVCESSCPGGSMDGREVKVVEGPDVAESALIAYGAKPLPPTD